MKLSIIIPTLEEEKYLPFLINSIKNQVSIYGNEGEEEGEEDESSSFPFAGARENEVLFAHQTRSDPVPLEIIVADAGSEDKTVEIAKSYGCKVIKGGLPARGRNEGEKVAQGELLLFLDADTILPENSLEKFLSEFKKRNLDVAGFLLQPWPARLASPARFESRSESGRQGEVGGGEGEESKLSSSPTEILRSKSEGEEESKNIRSSLPFAATRVDEVLFAVANAREGEETSSLLPPRFARENKFLKTLYNLFYNWPVLVLEKILPHSAGAILIKKSLYQKIGGFDEKIKIGEDHICSRKAVRFGRFGILRTAKVYYSQRRFERDGLIKTYFKYFLAELYLIFLGPIKSDIFKYDLESKRFGDKISK